MDWIPPSFARFTRDSEPENNPCTGLLALEGALCLFLAFMAFSTVYDLAVKTKGLGTREEAARVSNPRTTRAATDFPAFRKKYFTLSGGNVSLACGFFGLAWWSRRDPVRAAWMGIVLSLTGLGLTAAIDYRVLLEEDGRLEWLRVLAALLLILVVLRGNFSIWRGDET